MFIGHSFGGIVVAQVNIPLLDDVVVNLPLPGPGPSEVQPPTPVPQHASDSLLQHAAPRARHRRHPRHARRKLTSRATAALDRIASRVARPRAGPVHRLLRRVQDRQFPRDESHAEVETGMCMVLRREVWR